MTEISNVEDVQVFTDNKDLTLSNIRDMVDENDLILNPDYQRDYVYDDKRASRLVESILMEIPIPVIYLSKEDDGTYSVIDGQQRITSLVRFIKNEFSLRGLDVLNSFNNLKYKDLDKYYQRKYKSATLKAICLKKQSQHLKYEIFARLNQGSVSLKPQELRNCIYRGALNNCIEELAKENILKDLFIEQNNRKTYQEIILRFFAIREFQKYKTSLLKTMNEYMKENQTISQEKIQGLKSLFKGTMDIIKQVLGNRAFSSYDRENNEIINKFSGSVYDSIAVPFSMFKKHDLINNADKIRNALKDLKINNVQYQEDTYAATGSKKRVVNRIMTVYNLIAQIVGNFGDIEEARNFSREIKERLFHQGYICSYCDNKILSIDDAEVDHVIPFSSGGMTDISNAQLLHRHCNREKNGTIQVEIDGDNEEWELE